MLASLLFGPLLRDLILILVFGWQFRDGRVMNWIWVRKYSDIWVWDVRIWDGFYEFRVLICIHMKMRGLKKSGVCDWSPFVCFMVGHRRSEGELELIYRGIYCWGWKGFKGVLLFLVVKRICSNCFLINER